MIHTIPTGITVNGLVYDYTMEELDQDTSKLLSQLGS